MNNNYIRVVVALSEYNSGLSNSPAAGTTAAPPSGTMSFQLKINGRPNGFDFTSDGLDWKGFGEYYLFFIPDLGYNDWDYDNAYGTSSKVGFSGATTSVNWSDFVVYSSP